MPETRQLAAIMFTDIVGYTTLMGKDEAAAYRLLKTNRQIQKPLIEKHGGKWLKEIGDGVLASFQTITDAVYCAIEIQRRCTEEPGLKLRIGIHLGEVILEDGDVFGDGVNIASRLEAMAPPSSIYVSESVYRNIENKKGIIAEFVKEEALKNVKHLIRIYEINLEVSEIIDPDASTFEPVPEVRTRSQGWIKPVYIIPLFVMVVVTAYLVYNNVGKNKYTTEISEPEITEKSIAVLPFKNLSQDSENQYFADGIMEGILNNLSKIQDLRVASRSSTERYRENLSSALDIAEELNVNYLLEASVFKSENRIRVTTQLINAEKDEHIWSEQYDRDLNDVFKVMSEISIEVASEIKATILPETKSRIEYVHTENIQAYELYLKAINEKMFEDRIKLLDSAIALDPNFDQAYALKGAQWLYSGGGLIGTYSLHEILTNATLNINRALEINPDNYAAHENLGSMQLWYFWNFQEAEKQYQIAMQLNQSGFISGYSQFQLALGNYEKALSYLKKASETSPSSWYIKSELGLCQSYFMQLNEAQKNIEEVLMMSDNIGNYLRAFRAYLFLNQFESIISTSKKYFELYPEPKFRAPIMLAYLSISYYKTGEIDMAQELLEEIIEKSNEIWAGSPSYYISQIYAQMGETDQAFEWLEKAYQNHEIEMYWLKVEPPFEPLRSDPRFQVMLDKVGFPD